MLGPCTQSSPAEIRVWGGVLTTSQGGERRRSGRTAGSNHSKPGQANFEPAATTGEEVTKNHGLYLHWDGRRTYRTRMPAPRVLEPIEQYAYGSASGNRVIEGDNLQVMVSLRSQYRSGIDVAYLDPPYNTGRQDFRYSDRRFNDPDADSDDAVYVSSEDGGRHTKWLNYIGPRLYLVWELLADHGVCFVSINDIELFRLGMLMDEIFGERNRIAVLVWKQMADNNPTRVAIGHEYILCYAKQVDTVPSIWQGISEAKSWLLDRYQSLTNEGLRGRALERKFQEAIREHVATRKDALAKGEDTNLVDLGALDRYKYVDERGPYAAVRDTAVHAGAARAGYDYDIIHPDTGRVCKKPGSGYRFPPEKLKQLKADKRLIFGKNHHQLVQLKKYISDISPPLRGMLDIDSRKGGATLKRLFPDGAQRFPNPKPVELIEQLVAFAGDSDAIVLDPFAGSGTTGHAVLRLNERDSGSRRFIMIEEGTPEDLYCRTLTAPRLKAAIETEGLNGGFSFEAAGRRVHRQAILELEREAIANLIVQTDITGVGRGIQKIAGTYIIGSNARNEGIALCWNGRDGSVVDRTVLRSMFEEAKSFGLRKPIRAYGITCPVGETESFRFCQIPDEILAALQLAEEEIDDVEEVDLEAVTEVIVTESGGTNVGGRKQ